MFRQGWRERFRYAGFVRTKPEAIIVHGGTIIARIRVRRKPKGELPSPLRETLPANEGNRSLTAKGTAPSEQGDRLTLLGVRHSPCTG